MGTGRRVVGALVKIAASAAAILLAGELAIRVFFPLDALVYQDSDDPQLSFELRPGASGVKNGVDVVISAQGLRDDPVVSPRPPEERRVVVVGGHETFGTGVKPEETYVRELANGLLEPGEGRARTVNLSMYSYNLHQKVELACLRMRSMEPELVLLQINEGDDMVTRPPLVRWPRLKNWVRAHSMLIRWASERRYLGPYVLPAAPPSWAGVKADIKKFKECADAAGARSAVVLLPNLLAPGRRSEFGKVAVSSFKENGVPLLNAIPVLESMPPDQSRVFHDAPFLSPAAHRALSEALRRWLKPLLRRRPVKAPPRRPVA